MRSGLTLAALQACTNARNATGAMPQGRAKRRNGMGGGKKAPTRQLFQAQAPTKTANEAITIKVQANQKRRTLASLRARRRIAED